MKTVKLRLTESEARMVLFCLEKQKSKNVEVAEKVSKEQRPPEWRERLKSIHLQFAHELAVLKERLLLEMYNKKIKFKNELQSKCRGNGQISD